MACLPECKAKGMENNNLPLSDHISCCSSCSMILIYNSTLPIQTLLHQYNDNSEHNKKRTGEKKPEFLAFFGIKNVW